MKTDMPIFQTLRRVATNFFFDPDNGFEPAKSFTEKHVKFKEISRILDKLSDESVISVFQHHRRKSFPDDFASILSKINKGFCVAIYWHSLMFVLITRSKSVCNQLIEFNTE